MGIGTDLKITGNENVNYLIGWKDTSSNFTPDHLYLTRNHSRYSTETGLLNNTRQEHLYVIYEMGS